MHAIRDNCERSENIIKSKLFKHKKGHHMFGTNSIGQEYTFTEDRIKNSNISQDISSYLGKFGVSKEKNDAENDNVISIQEKRQQDKNKEKLSIEDENKDNLVEEKNEDKKPVDIFEDDSSASPTLTYGSDLSALTRSFDVLAAAVGSSDDRVTKSQLIALLTSLSAQASDEEFKEEVAFIKNLLAKFDTISEGEDYITSFTGVNEPQDYKTVTQDQVTSPISLLI